jgi:hypothetical protein
MGCIRSAKGEPNLRKGSRTLSPSAKRNQLDRPLARVQQHAREYLLERMQAVAERRDDTEICTRAPHRPEQI